MRTAFEAEVGAVVVLVVAQRGRQALRYDRRISETNGKCLQASLHFWDQMGQRTLS
jgi:hypothetical protein